MSIAAFQRFFENQVSVIEQAVAQLDDARLYAPVHPGGTSIASALSHLSSNLTSRFSGILTEDANKPWFDHHAGFIPPATRTLLLAAWESAINAVRGEVAILSDADLAKPVRIGEQRLSLDEALHRFLVHVAYHAGQVVLIARVHLGAAWRPLQSKPLRRPLTHAVISGPNGPLRVIAALPEGDGPHPAVLIGQEGIGVTGHLLLLAHRFAAAGLVAVIPDLYSRDAARRVLGEAEVVQALPLARAPDPAAAIAALPEERRASAQRVVAWFHGRDISVYAPDFAAALAWTRARADVRAEAVGAIGFSFGAGLVGQLAAGDAGLAAGVIVYGQLPGPEQAATLRTPLLGHFAANDAAINARIPAFAAAYERIAARRFVHTIHPGTSHGFFSETRAEHDPAAAQAVWDGTLVFLSQHLVAKAAAR